MMHIWIKNDGTGDKETGNYDVQITINGICIWTGRVEGRSRVLKWRKLIADLAKVVWRQFYIFDVYDHQTECYLPYNLYSAITDVLPFPIIAPIEIVTNPTMDHLFGLLQRNTYLIRDGEEPGEGIVIKRYDFVNQWNRTTWGKIVRNEFKERNAREFGTPKVKMSGDTETKLTQEYITRGRIVKALADMRSEAPLTSKRIPELFGRIWHEIIADEMWDIVKKHKKLVIDFGQFQRAVTEEIKKNCPELFGGS